MPNESNQSSTYVAAESSPRLVTARGVSIALYLLIAIALGVIALFAKPLIVAGAIVAIFVGLMIALYPYFGLISYYVVIVVRPEVLFPALATLRPARLIAASLLVSTIIHKKYRGESFLFLKDRMTRHFVYFLGALLASIPLSFWISNSFWFVMNFAWVFVYYLLIINTITSEMRLKGFIWLTMVSTGYTAISSAIAYFSGTLVVAQGIERAEGLSGTDPNTLAVSLMLGIPFLYFSLYWIRLKIVRVVPLVCLCGCVFTIAITGSRSGVIGLVATAFFIWLVSKYKMIIGVAAVLLMIAGWFALPPQYKERYATIFAEERDASTEGRIDAWKAGWGMFLANPVTGIGVDCFPLAYGSGQYSDTRAYLRSHNMYIQIIAETGVLGLLTFGALVFHMIASNFRLRKRLKEAGRGSHFYVWLSHSITASTGALFVTSIFGHSLFRGHWYTCAALTVVLVTLAAAQTSGPSQTTQSEMQSASSRSK